MMPLRAPTEENPMDAEQTLARWIAEEEAVRARIAPTPGFARPAQLEGRTGLAMLEAILAGEIARPPMSETLDFLLIRVEPFVPRPPRVDPSGPAGRPPACRSRRR
jgi:hypothetical protein